MLKTDLEDFNLVSIEYLLKLMPHPQWNRTQVFLIDCSDILLALFSDRDLKSAKTIQLITFFLETKYYYNLYKEHCVWSFYEPFFKLSTIKFVWPFEIALPLNCKLLNIYLFLGQDC